MEQLFENLKSKIVELSSNPEFIHHKWFIKWHLEIVERISLELCDIYKDADKDLVLGLVWMHDYAKIIDYENEHDPETIKKGIILLEELNFEKAFIDKLIEYINIFESKMTNDLSSASIEIRIVSSADATSHMVGPFMAIHWYEHPEKSVEELIEANQKKLAKDWDRKIVIPEVKNAFLKRYNALKELSGEFPDRFL